MNIGSASEATARRRGIALLVVAQGLCLPTWAESYDLTAATSLSLDGDVVVQAWSATCTGTDPNAEAVIVPGGKELRFFAAPDQVAAVGVDELTYPIGAEAVAEYRYDDILGARVFARLTVRCGTADVFDEKIVESLPLVVAPALALPSSVQRSDTLLPVADHIIPVGVEVELVGLGLLGNPRGDELLVFSIAGPGVDVTGELSADEVVDGHASLSPRFTANDVGEVVIDVSLLGAAATPLRFEVAVDDNPDPDPDIGGGDLFGSDGGAPSCSARAPGAGAGLAGVVALLLRRRRPYPA